MSSQDYLASQRDRVEEALDRLLPAAGMRPPALNEAIRYAVLSGGKRIRPVIALTASEAVAGEAGDVEAAIQAAVAIELLHNYTLIHDDLPAMDDDELRRGRPTVHVKFGEAMAILAGDALQALAFEAISAPTGLAPDRALRLVQTLARAAGPAGVVGGQVEDIAEGVPLDAERLAYIQLHKTADLFRTAAELGAIAGGGDDDDIAALSRFGECLGIAFQIVDDILDAKPGEPPETTSCLRLWTPEEAREAARHYTKEAAANLVDIPGTQASAALSDMAEQLLVRVV